MRAKSKYVSPSKPAGNASFTLFCSADAIGSHWARLVLCEKDIDGARIVVQVPGRPSEDLLVLNPSLVLPTLADRDTVIYAARVIVEYLEERCPHPPMMPLDPGGRARMRMIMELLERDIFPLLARLQETGSSAAAAKTQLSEQLVMSARWFPARGWFWGMDYSIVDCAWTALLWRLEQTSFAWPAGAEPLRRYAERAFARPAFKRSLTLAR